MCRGVRGHPVLIALLVGALIMTAGCSLFTSPSDDPTTTPTPTPVPDTPPDRPPDYTYTPTPSQPGDDLPIASFPDGTSATHLNPDTLAAQFHTTLAESETFSLLHSTELDGVDTDHGSVRRFAIHNTETTTQTTLVTADIHRTTWFTPDTALAQVVPQTDDHDIQYYHPNTTATGTPARVEQLTTQPQLHAILAGGDFTATDVRSLDSQRVIKYTTTTLANESAVSQLTGYDTITAYSATVYVDTESGLVRRAFYTAETPQLTVHGSLELYGDAQTATEPPAWVSDPRSEPRTITASVTPDQTAVRVALTDGPAIPEGATIHLSNRAHQQTISVESPLTAGDTFYLAGGDATGALHSSPPATARPLPTGTYQLRVTLDNTELFETTVTVS